jgi:hypothetical protein
MLFATIVDTQVLWKLVTASIVGGIGGTVAFALVVYGATRSAELRRDGRIALAGVFATVAGVALAAILGGVVYGVSILSQKT